MEKEKHPYLEKYPLTKVCKYLVVGTFPPPMKKNRLNYFYGNVSSFWKIMKQLYPNNSFEKVTDILEWQDQYSVGFTDTVFMCKRKNNSSKDSDLIIDWVDYNHSIKEYIVLNHHEIEKVIFTSGNNCNNALFNFKIIMGDQYLLIEKKIISDLPSPSGNANLAYFNRDNETLGLKKELYNYLIMKDVKSDIEYIRNKWMMKVNSDKGKKIKERVPKEFIFNFKKWKYDSIFPKFNMF